jgi:arylsulfatase A-like enzyme
MIHRRAFLGAVGAGLARAQSARPNVVILLADDLGWRDVGFHGSEIRTPHLDRLAASGIEIDRFYSHPLCSPTRSALMTGRSPMRFGVMYSVIRPWLDYGIPVEERLMPEAFHAAGYQTAITGKWHLGHSRAAFLPNARGFDHAYGHVNGAIDYFTHIRDGGLDWHRNGKTVREEGYSTDLLAAEAVKFIRQRDKQRPFFLYVPFNAPHTPLQAPPERLAKYASLSDERRRTFAAMVDGLDEGVGGILSTLASEKIDDRTIVLFFSDNGGPVAQAARNTPLRGAKGSCWEGGLRVPAVLRWPGQLKPGKSKQVMAAMDVFPTLSAAAGIQPSTRLPLDGRNLWPEISAGRARPRETLFFAVEPSPGNLHYAVHRREWKLVRVESPSGGGEDHLFRIGEDPNEERDVAAHNAAVVKELRAELDQWKALHPANGVRAANRPPAGWKAPPRWAEAARS